MVRAILAKEDPDSQLSVCFDSSPFWRSSARCFFLHGARHPHPIACPEKHAKGKHCTICTADLQPRRPLHLAVVLLTA